MTHRLFVRSLMLSAALAAGIALGGCDTTTLPTSERATRPLSDRMVAEIEAKNMDKDSPILVRAFKEESELEVWKQDRSGRFALLKTYPICRWSGELGPKIKEGDRQAPEGFYTITPGQMNPKSAYYLSFDLGYPNAFDRAHGRTGAQLMVHGDCSSRGCYSMTDEQISEIYALGRDAFFGGQKSFQVQAYPFRMTAENMARHRDNPHFAFWKMIKRGNDHFEVSGQEPKVNVCEKRYVFDGYSPGDPTRSPHFDPSGKCPAYEVPQEIASAVQQKQKQDDVRFAELVRRNVATAPIKTNADGGMHPVFVAAVKRNQVGSSPVFSLASTPGTIPAHVNPPRIAELSDYTASTPAAAATPAAPTRSTRTAAAPAETSTPTWGAPASGGFFGGMFASNPPAADSKAEAKPEPKSEGAFDRMARAWGFKKDEQEAAPTAEAKPKRAPVRQATAHGAIRPKTETAAKPQAAPAPAQTAEARPAASTPAAFAPVPAPSAPASNNGSISGAAPTVPAGSFDSRWSGGFR